jgi:hypothetical protein
VGVFCFKKSFGGLKKSRIFVIVKKEIIYTEHYVLIVSELTSTGKEGQVFLTKENTIHTVIGWNYGDRVIIAHRPLTDAPILERVPLLPYFGQEDDVEDLALAYASSKGYVNPEGYSDKQVGLLHGFIDGYNKAKETYKYTEEDLRKAMYFSTHGEYGKEKTTIGFIQSLQQRKRPKYFECEMSPMNLDEIRENGKGFLYTNTNKMVVITNSQGQTELVGKYIY